MTEVQFHLPHFRTPDEVQAMKLRLDALMQNVNDTVLSCTLDADALTSLQHFLHAWGDFSSESVHFWTAGSDYDACITYETQARAWLAFLATQTCRQ